MECEDWATQLVLFLTCGPVATDVTVDVLAETMRAHEESRIAFAVMKKGVHEVAESGATDCFGIWVSQPQTDFCAAGVA